MSLEKLFAAHIPTVLRERFGKGFDDGSILSLAHRAIDEYWHRCGSTYVRSGSHRLELQRDLDGYLESGATEESFGNVHKAFLTAEVELRIQPGMTLDQQEKLARVFRRIGTEFASRECYAHARACFTRAAHLFAQVRMFREEDATWYEEGRAELSEASGVRRIGLCSSFLFAGFGYRPYRLLYWCLGSILAFVPLYAWFEPNWSWRTSLVVSGMNYLAMLGLGDIGTAAYRTQLLAIAQGSVSLVLNATLFALLVRRWFRS